MSRKIRCMIALCICMMVVNTCGSNVDAKALMSSLRTEQEIENQIDKYTDDYIGKTTVGAEIAVMKDGKTAFRKAYGYSDYEAQTPLTEGQVMEWGSVTKLFTWVAVMQLVEQDKLDLNVDARKYLTDSFLKKSKLDKAKEFTILQLMNHTAGFEDAIINLGFEEEDRIVSLEQALCKARVEQCYEPGMVMAYSNYGASLAGYIVECITGKDFYEYIQENIFQVLGMSQTTMNPHASEELKALKPKGYNAQGKGVFAEGIWTYVSLYPCGSINGTIEDMEKFVAALLLKKNERSPLFKEKETLDTLFETTYQIDSETEGIAHGFFEYDGNKDVYFHKGNSVNFSSVVAFNRKDRSALLVACNQANEADIVSGLFNALYDEKANEEPVTPDIDYENLKWSDTYVPARYVDSGYLRILRESGFLCMDSVSKDEVILKQLGSPISFKSKNGNYIYDGGELVLGVHDNEVTHFKLGNIEYVPAPDGHSQLGIVGMVLALVVCILYFVISFVIKSICFIIRFIKHKDYGIIRKNKWIISIIGVLLVVNNALLAINSLPWPVSGKIMIYLIINYILALVLAGVNVFYVVTKVCKCEKHKWKHVVPVAMSTLLIVVMLYWNLFSIS